MCEIANISFNNYIWNAPIPLSLEEMKMLNKSDSGALKFKTRTLLPKKGNPNNYTLHNNYSTNNIALHNNGIQQCIYDIHKIKPNKPVFISIYGTMNELKQIIQKTNTLNYKILLEWNISCPNISNTPIYNKENYLKLRSLSKHPIGIKTKYFQNIDYYNIDFITAMNTINGKGGKIIKKECMRYIKHLRTITNIPIIAVGGVESQKDINDYLCIGANAVEIGTTYLRNGIHVFKMNKYKQKLINNLYNHDIIQKGNFHLKSGKKSSTYIDLRLCPSIPDIWQSILI